MHSKECDELKLILRYAHEFASLMNIDFILDCFA